jgi:hypothetical protein
MYYNLEDDTYTLIGRIQPTATPKPSIISSIATSKPAQAIDKFNKTFIDLMVSSLGFVAALSWSNYFKSLFEEGGPFYNTVGQSGLLYVALFATLLAYFATIFVTTLYPERQIAKKENPIEKSIEKD